MKRIGEILADMGLVPPTPDPSSAGSGQLPPALDEAELYAHRAMRRFNLAGKVTSGLPVAALEKVTPKAAREAVIAFAEVLVEDLVAQAYKDGNAARRQENVARPIDDIARFG
jgi:hypothetical protein